MGAAAGLGEVTACLVRVPVEIVKQRRQAGALSSVEIVRSTWRAEGLGGFYRGYLTTVAREASLCGAIAGGVSAGLTTPLDVAKTRIMLAKPGTEEAGAGTLQMWRIVAREAGVRGLFAGLVPRVTWISVGGAVFFGVYEKIKSVLVTLS